MPSKLLDGPEVEVLEWAGVVEGMHGLIHVLGAPLTLPTSQQIAVDPSLRRLDLLGVLGECPFPDAPQNATEDAATVAVGQTGGLDERAVVPRSLPALCLISDQVVTGITGLEKPSHDWSPLGEWFSNTHQAGVGEIRRNAGISIHPAKGSS